MITAVFTDNSDYARATGLWQWDYGQRLRIEGLKLPTAIEIHFALTEQSGDAIPRVGITKDGVTEVVIPDSLLEHQAAGVTYEIYAWIYLADKTSGETIKRISMQVKRRPKPEGFDTPEDAELFREAIEAVNASADRAETAREGAEAAQKAAEAAAGKIEGEITGAGQIAEQVRQDADAVAKDKQAVSQLATETTQNAQKAAKAAQAAERSSTAAKEAQTAAENAGERATSAMEATEKDRTEVAENRKAVEQAKEAVAADRRAVENTALQFGQFAQSAINAVGQAQEAAVQAVSAEGQKQTTAVQRAGTQAVSDVTAAKTEAVQAVTTEGDTQTKRVQDAAAGIVADREQIAANKAGIEALSQKKADAIVETAQGETMTLTDSSDKLFEGLRVFGKSTQDGTPSVENPVPIVNAGESGSITVEVTGRNLLKPNSYGTYYEFPLKANTVITLMTNGKPSRGGNIKFSAIDGSTVWFSIDAGQTRVCRSIGNKDVKGFYDVLNVDGGLEYMFAVGDIKNYAPYVEPQSLALTTPNGLPGVPVSKDGNYVDSNGQQWVCDEVDLGRGKYVQRVSNLTFDGVTDGHKCTDTDGYKSNGFTNAYTPAPNKKTNGAALMNILTGGGSSGVGFISSSVIGLSFGNERCGIIETDSKIDIVNKVNAVIKEINDTGTEVIAYYELNTPIERDLTPEELAAYSSLHTNYPTTVITNDAGAHTEASYVADTGTYIRNMESRLNAKLVNIQSALISQKISGGGIKVTDSSRVPVVRFVMWGKTEQRKTTGKNLIDIKGEITFSKGTFDIKDNLIDCTLADTWGGSYIMFSKEYPAGEYTFSADKMKNGAVQKIAILLTVEPLSYSVDSCVFNNYYKNYLIKNGKTLSRDITFKVDSPFEIGIPLSGDNDVVGETLSIKNIQLERGASATAYEPYSGGFPSPSPDWEQPIEITDQPVTVTVKGGAEQQSITLIPPKPMTKWDKLEKVDGVWCWVYQHKVLTGAEMAKNVNAIHSSSALMVSTLELGITGEQNGAISNKFVCPVKSVSSLVHGEFRILQNNIYIKIDGVTTDEEGRQWLESNDITIIAQASAPEPISLSPSEQAQLNALTMYAGTTEVTNTGGCNMELTYTVDTKSYVDSKIAAISAAVLEV